MEKFAYKPWGMRRNPANWSENVVNDYPARFSRGYCMHEHLSNLGLINMGGRVYNARTNQFISPDPYRQAPDSWLNCNRFGYCMGNPVMYTDPTGELWWLIPAIAAFVGGTANLVSNWDNIDGFWQGFASFGVGAAAGFGTACAFTFGGPAAGMFAATGTGAITAATNNIIGQTGRNFEGFSNIDVQSVWKSAGRGALIAGISSVAGCYGSQLGSSLFSGISSPILQSGLVGMTAGLASGLAGGSMAAGLYQDPNLIWQSSLLSAGLGFAIPATYSGIQSARMGINPWTGKATLDLSKFGINSTQKGLNPDIVDDYYNQMADGSFNASDRPIAGYKYNNEYYITDGHHRMAAAYRIYVETGNKYFIDQLIKYGSFDNNNPATYGYYKTRLFK